MITIENLEANLNSNFASEKEAVWEVEVEGKVSESLLKKIQGWYDDGCDTDEDYVDEYVNEVALFADGDAQVIIRYSHIAGVHIEADFTLTHTQRLEDRDEEDYGCVASFRLDTAAGSSAQVVLYRDLDESGVDDEWTAVLEHIFVVPAERRQGLAKAMVAKAIEVAREEWGEDLKVRAIPEHDKPLTAEQLARFYENSGLTLID